MAWISWLRTEATTTRTTTTSRKPLKCSSKILRWKRMYLLLRADQRLKQNHKDVLLPAHLQELYPSGKELGLMLSQKIIRPSLTQCENNWVLFFVMVIYLEKKMERLNSGDWRIIFQTICAISTLVCGRVQWQKAEETRKDFNIVLIHQDKKFFISELFFKVIQDAIPFDPSLQDDVLIPNDFFEYIYHIGCAINLHSITNSGLIPGGQIWAKERRYSLQPCRRIIKIQWSWIWPNHVLHLTNESGTKSLSWWC